MHVGGVARLDRLVCRCMYVGILGKSICILQCSVVVFFTFSFFSSSSSCSLGFCPFSVSGVGGERGRHFRIHSTVGGQPKGEGE